MESTENLNVKSREVEVEVLGWGKVNQDFPETATPILKGQLAATVTAAIATASAATVTAATATEATATAATASAATATAATATATATTVTAAPATAATELQLAVEVLFTNCPLKYPICSAHLDSAHSQYPACAQQYSRCVRILRRRCYCALRLLVYNQVFLFDIEIRKVINIRRIFSGYPTDIFCLVAVPLQDGAA